VSEFVVETYTSQEMTGFLARRVEDVAAVAERVSQDGARVRLLRAIFLPEEETCFYLFETASADAVGQAVSRAPLHFARISEAVSITPRNARARPNTKTSHPGRKACRQEGTQPGR